MTPNLKGQARKAANTMLNAPTKQLKKDSPFKSSYAGRSCPTMPNSRKPSVAKSMYGAISNDSLALSIPPSPVKQRTATPAKRVTYVPQDSA